MLRFSDIPPRIGRLTGWRRNLAAFACGVMATLSLPPFFLVFLLIPSFTGLVWLLDSAPTRRRIFADGWWWGWGFYMTGLYWFCIALLTDVEKFAWLIPFALFGLTGVIALYSGVACWLMGFIRAGGITRIFIFSVIWTLVEIARGCLFTGFPWNLPGYVFAVSDASLQLASLVGAYGLTWIAVFLAALPAALGRSRHAPWALALAYGLLAAGLGWGAWRLQEAGDTQYVDGVRLRLVQADIAQEYKWDPVRRMEGLKQYARLTQSPGLERITHVIWPETAVPYVMKPGGRLAHMLGTVLPPGGHLITGALRAQGEGDDWKIWNSMAMLDVKGNVMAAYDKFKLVPFGEFLPFRSLLPEMLTTPVGDTDFSRGRRGVTLDVPDETHAMLPLICYEAIFPGLAVSDPSFAPPSWILNITNDAWFGLSTGPHQHFQMARMRAAEQGLPLIRVANTGISAVVDGYGRIKGRIGLGKQGILDTPLPKPSSGTTLYSLWGDGLLLFLAISALILIIIANNRRNLERK